MKAIVTGAAGFIGSHVSERLVTEGWQVVGVDCFTPYYASADKLANLATLIQSDQFELQRADLRDADLSESSTPLTRIFHLAAQPGVRASWSDGFQDYATNNVVATQRLLDAVQASDSRTRVDLRIELVRVRRDRHIAVGRRRGVATIQPLRCNEGGRRTARRGIRRELRA